MFAVLSTELEKLCWYLYLWWPCNDRMSQRLCPNRKKAESKYYTYSLFYYREALVAKTLGPELKSALGIVGKIVNYIKMRPLKRPLFAKLCESMEADYSF